MNANQVLELDKRSFFKIYYHYLLCRHFFFQTFINSNLSNPFYIRISLFFMSLCINFCINAILFSDDLIDKRNLEEDQLLINVKTNIEI